MTAEILPFEKAVKRAEVNILKPANKKLMENNKNPSLARSNTGVPAGEKMAIKEFLPKNARE